MKSFDSLWEILLKNKNRVAIYENQIEITYDQLMEKVYKYAIYLNKYSIKKDDIICILADHTAELISCVLGILYAGGAYAIINPRISAEEIDYILKETNSKCFFVAKDAYDNCTNSNKVLMDSSEFEVTKKIDWIERHESQLAYLVFTSGSSGKPKSIMTEDRHIISYILAYIEKFTISNSDKILQQSPVYYDGFAEEIFSMLFSGGAIVVEKKEILKFPRLIKRTIETNRITIMPSTPMMLKAINELDGMHSIRVFISSGEVLKKSYIGNLAENAKVYNMYGPTETTVCATYHEVNCRDEENIPIGKPLTGYQLHIYKNNEMIHDSTVGEIFISGCGVARGYLSQLNNCNNLFVIHNGVKMFRTGDYGYCDNLGNYWFVGRIDRQVKLRGNRVELGYVEELLNSYLNGITTVVVPVKINSTVIGLYAYYVGNEAIEVDIKNLCNSIMPDYMIPLKFDKISEIPLIDTGKVDYKLLEDRIIINLPIQCEPTDNVIERSVLEAFALVLDEGSFIDDITLNSKLSEMNFDSLKFIQVVVEIEERFDIEFDDEYLNLELFNTVDDFYNYVNTKVVI